MRYFDFFIFLGFDFKFHLMFVFVNSLFIGETQYSKTFEVLLGLFLFRFAITALVNFNDRAFIWVIFLKKRSLSILQIRRTPTEFLFGDIAANGFQKPGRTELVLFSILAVFGFRHIRGILPRLHLFDSPYPPQKDGLGHCDHHGRVLIPHYEMFVIKIR